MAKWRHHSKGGNAQNGTETEQLLPARQGGERGVILDVNIQ